MASGLMGMISGSAAANVAGTGVLTIPLMKKVGYRPEEAGAIEAAASTGGQIMPPIMGTGAFLMAELLGIKYLEICKAAVIPALTYYFAVFVVVHLLAKKRAALIKYEPMKLDMEPILPRLYLLSPIAVLIGAIGMGYTLQRAAIIGIVSILVLNIISPRMRHSPLHLIQQLLNATKLSSSISQPISGCGIIIGIVTISGLATRLSAVIAAFGGDLMWIGLLITMLGCILLGMALPTVAAYLTAYVLFLPTLKSIGIDPLAANMFIFYFGIFAQITPPVCVASYTAAGIAQAKPWDTGWRGMVFASCAFFAPFVFVYQPAILLQGTLLATVYSTATLVMGTSFLAMGVAGYVLAPLKVWERALLVIAGIMTCLPEAISDYGGMMLAAVVIIHQVFVRIKVNKQKSQRQIV
jgi:TRAP transporter 4TM/12TM fusion protein